MTLVFADGSSQAVAICDRVTLINGHQGSVFNWCKNGVGVRVDKPIEGLVPVLAFEAGDGHIVSLDVKGGVKQCLTTMALGDSSPVLGMGVTEGIGSDCRPYTIIEIHKEGKELVIQADSFVRVDNNGISETQVYEYTRNGEGEKVTLHRNHKGNYGQLGKRGYYYVIGQRRKYSDPSF
jgi:hypothetical protein